MANLGIVVALRERCLCDNPSPYSVIPFSSLFSRPIYVHRLKLRERGKYKKVDFERKIIEWESPIEIVKHQIDTG